MVLSHSILKLRFGSQRGERLAGRRVWQYLLDQTA